jgi:hypothetical protein
MIQAVALGCYMMREWLHDFEYQVPITWDMFAIAGVIAMATEDHLVPITSRGVDKICRWIAYRIVENQGVRWSTKFLIASLN